MLNPQLIGDLENRMALCRDVIDAYREDGLRLERALAMLHRLTDLRAVEPYLSDVPVVALEPFEIENGGSDDWPEVSPDDEVILATREFSVLEHCCDYCRTPLERREGESDAAWEGRTTCNRSCAAKLRAEGRRIDESAEVSDHRCKYTFCGKPIVRKRYDSGRLEPPATFDEREFCDGECRRKQRKLERDVQAARGVENVVFS